MDLDIKKDMAEGKTAVKSTTTSKRSGAPFHKILQIMKSSYFLLPATALTGIVWSTAAAPVIDTIEQLNNPRTLIANNHIKRQSTPICSSVCGAPTVQGCMDVQAADALFCKTETFSAPNGEDCKFAYTAPSDGTCTTPDDLTNLVNTLANTCLLGSAKSGGCIDGSNGARVCMFSNESPCH